MSDAIQHRMTKSEFKKANPIAPLIEKFHGRCAFCRNKVFAAPTFEDLQDDFAASRDHDIPKTRGGADTGKNIILTCRLCNSAKGSMTGDEFRYLLRTKKLAPSYAEWIAAIALKTLADRRPWRKPAE